MNNTKNKTDVVYVHHLFSLSLSLLCSPFFLFSRTLILLSSLLLPLNSGIDEQDSWTIHVPSFQLAHSIRDAIYRAMASSRQINPFEDLTDPNTSLDQLNRAPNENTIVGTNNDKLVITKDRLLFLKHRRGGIKREWVEIFQKDIKGVEINSPAQWPSWYAVVWYFPPWGLCGSKFLIFIIAVADYYYYFHSFSCD